MPPYSCSIRWWLKCQRAKEFRHLISESTRILLTEGKYNGCIFTEEMFSTFREIWFSPQGGHLAFASFNDTQVRDIQFLLYGEPGQFPRFQYPVVESIPYPKV